MAVNKPAALDTNFFTAFWNRILIRDIETRRIFIGWDTGWVDLNWACPGFDLWSLWIAGDSFIEVFKTSPAAAGIV
jgi:hypothetical protein